MAEPNKPQPIVVKRIKKVAGGHHGGAWKIAYADFVTAMMAFFLLMWLLGSTTKAQLQGIAEYFQNPMKVSMEGGSGAGSAMSVLQAGGTDLTRTTGQVRDGSTPGKEVKPNATTVVAIREAEIDKANLQALKAALEAQIDANPQLAAFKSQLMIDITREGLRIQVVDNDKRPMFALGGAQLEGYARTIFQEIAPTLNRLPNKISITGHTDALMYQNQGKGYSNYNLSADRANAVRQVLVQSGLEEQKVLRVVGMGSAAPFDPSDPKSPLNRRVSIVVLTQEAAKRILANQALEQVATDAEEAKGQIDAGPGVSAGAASAPVASQPAQAAASR
ncbi:chemotaxis protein MotB [Tibeticola sediminis]|jgi:chemotaxis protein MotB|uniref:Chemotaxis protein MotB n=1 Tax=Tibeticola sediminis TaxID=1917811 RepID=A0A3N4UJ00_9BURK|nr:flagellar motor protein MotB [Tibeticola sediminis]RPE70542.1 chemotaxis protein MotB [Tibeticola sediminis]